MVGLAWIILIRARRRTGAGRYFALTGWHTGWHTGWRTLIFSGDSATLGAMPLLEPVIWAKGTVLNPQHLQIQDRFLVDSLQFQLQALNFRPWGFQRLRIDQQALATGTLTLSEAAGIMSDGLLFDIPESDPAPSPRPIADRFAPDQETLAVYLAIPHYREQGLNVANGIRDVEARYRAEVAMIRDDNTGQSERPVMMARKNFRLLVRGRKPGGQLVVAGRQHPQNSRRRISDGPAFRGSHARRRRQRLPAFHRPPAGGNPVRQKQHAGRFAAPEKSEPGGLHRLRYRQFLAALYHQHGVPHLQPPV